MISRVLVIAQGGLLAYSKNFINIAESRDSGATEGDLISGFISAISTFAKEIKGGNIHSLNFKNFNIVMEYDTETDTIFFIICDINDIEEEVRERSILLKEEFIKRHKERLMNWTGELVLFQDMEAFVEENIFIPPKILIVGEVGVGKTTIMDLFPGETIIEIDEDLNEIIQKTIYVQGLNLRQFIIREMNIEELVDNSKLYKPLLNNADIIIIVTNSGASNLARTAKLYPILKKLVKKADFYVIANFQDNKELAFEPIKIEELFDGLKTYGFAGTEKKAQEKMFNIMVDVLNKSIVEKIQHDNQEITS
ncbi:MAG: GTPase domain-containing protein [Candidatus Lokiarchaeota archaeon]|nr:GTPase domain-containing protein [Candidatus Lokiarchaeota archaeon]